MFANSMIKLRRAAALAVTGLLLCGGAWAQIASLAAGTTSYSNTGLSASTAYSYRIKATNSIGDSSYSSTASATTQSAPTGPAAPSNLDASANSSTSITITWTGRSEPISPRRSSGPKR